MEEGGGEGGGEADKWVGECIKQGSGRGGFFHVEKGYEVDGGGESKEEEEGEGGGFGGMEPSNKGGFSRSCSKKAGS